MNTMIDSQWRIEIDYEYIARLQKRLDELYVAKMKAHFNIKDSGDIRESMGFIKAIQKFGELIATNNDQGETK